jgi:hypothetical protein
MPRFTSTRHPGGDSLWADTIGEDWVCPLCSGENRGNLEECSKCWASRGLLAAAAGQVRPDEWRARGATVVKIPGWNELGVTLPARAVEPGVFGLAQPESPRKGTARTVQWGWFDSGSTPDAAQVRRALGKLKDSKERMRAAEEKLDHVRKARIQETSRLALDSERTIVTEAAIRGKMIQFLGEEPTLSLLEGATWLLTRPAEEVTG